MKLQKEKLDFDNIRFLAFTPTSFWFVDFNIFATKLFLEIKDEFIKSWSHENLDDEFAVVGKVVFVNPKCLLKKSDGSDGIEIFNPHGIWRHVGLDKIYFADFFFLENLFYFFCIGDVLHIGMHPG